MWMVRRFPFHQVFCHSQVHMCRAKISSHSCIFYNNVEGTEETVHRFWTNPIGYAVFTLYWHWLFKRLTLYLLVLVSLVLLEMKQYRLYPGTWQHTINSNVALLMHQAIWLSLLTLFKKKKKKKHKSCFTIIIWLILYWWVCRCWVESDDRWLPDRLEILTDAWVALFCIREMPVDFSTC